MGKILCYIALILFILNINLAYSQETNQEFKPSGRIIAQSFLDYSTNFNDKSGFDLTRALLGYNYQFLPTLQGRVVIDGASGKDSSGKLEPYIRNVYVNWKDKGFDISVGLIGLLQFSTQDAYWTHRYVSKSFQDLNGMGYSVDIGFTAKYDISPMFSVDFSLTNGEGYKKIQADDNMKYALGVNFKPIKNSVIRVYGDYYNKSEDGNTQNIKRNDQKTLSVFAGYQVEKISFGAEYNYQLDKDFVDGKDFYGYSVYSSVRVAPKWKVFGRFDSSDSANPPGITQPWSTKDGQIIMVGTEFQPIKQIKIAPNFRNVNYNGKDADQYFFISTEFNL